MAINERRYKSVSSPQADLQVIIFLEMSWPFESARRNIQAASPASAWLLFIDKFILEHIRKCTITEAHRQPKTKNFV